MDISGPVRTALERFVTRVDPETIAEPLAFFVQMTAVQNHPPVGVPHYLQDAAGTLSRDGDPPMQRYLALAAAMRVLPRISRFHRDAVINALRPHLEALTQAAENLLLDRTATHAAFLWRYWLLVLARERLRMVVPEMLMKGLWRRGWGGQSKEGRLHLDLHADAVQLDLCALHAAYNAIAMTRELERLEPIERLVRWHIAGLKPEAAPHPPWALAAFATLDETGHAQRLMTAAIAGLETNPADSLIVLTLLADALVTQEEIAAG